MHTALPFEIGTAELNPKYADKVRVGAFTVAIGLADGREAFCKADRAYINTAGTLTLWRDYSNTENGNQLNQPHGPMLLLALPAGQWSHYYTCTVEPDQSDGCEYPAAIYHLQAPD